MTSQKELRLLWRSSLPVLACTGVPGMLAMIPKGDASKNMTQIIDCHSSWETMQCFLSIKNSRESWRILKSIINYQFGIFSWLLNFKESDAMTNLLFECISSSAKLRRHTFLLILLWYGNVLLQTVKVWRPIQGQIFISVFG